MSSCPSGHLLTRCHMTWVNTVVQLSFLVSDLNLDDWLIDWWLIDRWIKWFIDHSLLKCVSSGLGWHLSEETFDTVYPESHRGGLTRVCVEMFYFFSDESVFWAVIFTSLFSFLLTAENVSLSLPWNIKLESSGDTFRYKIHIKVHKSALLCWQVSSPQV